MFTCMYFEFVCHLLIVHHRCWGEPYTVQREGVNVRFLSGDGIVKNVPENKAAVFEVRYDFVL